MTLRYRLSISAPREGDEMDSYVRTDLLDNVKNTLQTHGLLEKQNDVWSFAGPFLLGMRGCLWTVQYDFSILSAPKWGTAVGSGYEVALGALHALRGWSTPDRRLLTALVAAESVVTTVRRPHRVYRLSLGRVEKMTELGGELEGSEVP